MSSQRKQKQSEPLSCESEPQRKRAPSAFSFWWEINPKTTWRDPRVCIVLGRNKADASKTLICFPDLLPPPKSFASGLRSLSSLTGRRAAPLTEEVAQLWVQNLQQRAELKELLLHSLLGLLKVLVLQTHTHRKKIEAALSRNMTNTTAAQKKTENSFELKLGRFSTNHQLHEASQTPEGLHFVLSDEEDWSEEVAHPLDVTWINKNKTRKCKNDERRVNRGTNSSNGHQS